MDGPAPALGVALLVIGAVGFVLWLWRSGVNDRRKYERMSKDRRARTEARLLERFGPDVCERYGLVPLPNLETTVIENIIEELESMREERRILEA